MQSARSHFRMTVFVRRCGEGSPLWTQNSLRPQALVHEPGIPPR
ncbi:hypothetical protein SLNWT_3083 [Streptomyces albus]|uniref:Uncharacterized protein n=1 Tax=Streptomyces albus (strain ATCC 21838 / DSM 41398 / FERM P-419 / JCM 4703 / NBRC 107858) TaxID=1081613 RepID=A0A0B5EPH1_STRA4|nr:hypothetical protein SLNWT_3083 [Streptomyces albus]AOU77768.1 hypothetical protein SLNHY_3077 [Streptomyces albus]